MKKVVVGLALAIGLALTVAGLAGANHAVNVEQPTITANPEGTLAPDIQKLSKEASDNVTAPGPMRHTLLIPRETVAPMETVPPMPTKPPSMRPDGR